MNLDLIQKHINLAKHYIKMVKDFREFGTPADEYYFKLATEQLLLAESYIK